ncbi:MAG TPA: hypothetical protein VK987_07930 [Anaerolineae bacterium]|nr:hypothetical protein [Anaerolineae bacterium]
MNQALTDLDRLEREVFRRFYEDGVFDLYLGAMLLVFFASATLWETMENVLVAYVGMLASALIVTVPLLRFRRRLLRERLGSFTPGPRRRFRITRTRWVLAASVVLGLVAFAIAAVVYVDGISADLVAFIVPLLWLVNAVVVFGAMAYLLDVPRFAVYGIVGGLLMPLLIWPDALWGVRLPPWLVFGAAGVSVMVVGFWKLRRFLRRYPAPRAQ